MRLNQSVSRCRRALCAVVVAAASYGCAAGSDTFEEETVEAAAQPVAGPGKATAGAGAKQTTTSGTAAKPVAGRSGAAMQSGRPAASAAAAAVPPKAAGCAEECAEGMYCAFPSDANCGADDASAGTCKPLASDCPDEFQPVCGCNGVNYLNACDAEANGVSVRKAGSC